VRPPDEERRPAQAAVPQVVATTDSTVTATTASTEPYGRRGASGPLSCDHLIARDRFCVRCVNRRRRVQRELETIAPVHYRRAAPCTYGLDDRQLRTEANRLHGQSWQLDEITQVLAIEPASSS
jgi:hypothetical protein